MANRVIVAGVGMTEFRKPTQTPPYGQLGEQAAREALEDSGLEFSDVQQAYASYVYGETSCGQYVLRNLGATGIPVINVHNACASGSTALFLARQLIESGAAECVMAVGFEQMPPGPLQNTFPQMQTPFGVFEERCESLGGDPAVPLAIRIFGTAAVELREKHGVTPETFAKVVTKARRHAEHNSRAIFRQQLTVDDVLNSPTLYGPVTRLQACPPTCGAAAVVLVSEAFAARKGLTPKVAILAQAMGSDVMDIGKATSALSLMGDEIVRKLAKDVYEAAGIGPEDVDVAEIHDCFTPNELALNASLGFAAGGDTERFVQDDQNTYGGAVVINPSGGLLSKGHPLGATGLAQCAEIVWQLRGETGVRQVEGARIGMSQNSGVGSTCVISLYERL